MTVSQPPNGIGLTNETADKHEHIFPPYINALPSHFPLSLRPSPPFYPLRPKAILFLDSPCNLHTRHGSDCRHGHPTFSGLLNLRRVSYFMHTFHFRFLISSGNSLEGIQSVQFVVKDIRTWRALQIAPHASRSGLACRLEYVKLLLFSWIEINSPGSLNHLPCSPWLVDTVIQPPTYMM